jgi:hypothetical protein
MKNHKFFFKKGFFTSEFEMKNPTKLEKALDFENNCKK